MSSMKLDPITLEILWTRLVSAVDEAAAAFVRTSFSTLVREANDFAVVLTDAKGRSLAQSSMSIPSFIGTLPASTKHFLEHFTPEGLAPGDVLITNDPWKGTGHVHDVTIVMPIFRRGPAPLVRLLMLVSLCLAMLVLDLRFRYLEVVRQGLSVVIYPLQLVAAAPAR